jgi:hypothetical protein
VSLGDFAASAASTERWHARFAGEGPSAPTSAFRWHRTMLRGLAARMDTAAPEFAAGAKEFHRSPFETSGDP